MRKAAPVGLVLLLVLLPACGDDDGTGGGVLDQVRVEAQASVTADHSPVVGEDPHDVTVQVQVAMVNPTREAADIATAEAIVFRETTREELWRVAYARVCVDPVAGPCSLASVPPHGSAGDTWTGKDPEVPQGVCGEKLRVRLLLHGPSSTRTVDLPTAMLYCTY